MKVSFQRTVPGSMTQRPVRAQSEREEVEIDGVQEITLTGFVGVARALEAVRFSADSTPTFIIGFNDDARTTYALRGDPKDVRRGLIVTRSHKPKTHAERHEYLSAEGWKERPDLTQIPPDALRFGPIRD
jgi:hypothetical protein